MLNFKLILESLSPTPHVFYPLFQKNISTLQIKDIILIPY